MMDSLRAIPRRLAIVALPLALLLALSSVGCEQEANSTSSIAHAAIDPASLYPRSLDQMISSSGVIVRATLRSATAATEAVGGEHRPVQKLRFTVHEYVKGSGPNEIVVVVRPRDTHSTEGAARSEADRLLSERNTTWDDRQALLLLIRPTRDWYSDWYRMPDIESSGRDGRCSQQDFELECVVGAVG